MSADLSSWLWYILAAVLVLLAIAIGYAQWAWRRASPSCVRTGSRRNDQTALSGQMRKRRSCGCLGNNLRRAGLRRVHNLWMYVNSIVSLVAPRLHRSSRL